MRVLISIGSNLEPRHHLAVALAALEARYGSVTTSPVYESAAVGFDGPPFLNLVAAFDTAEAVGTTAGALRRIEDECGRDRSGPRFSSRTLDLDILLHGDTVGEVDGVRLPRDEILTAPFVLRPLADVAPQMCHPADGRSFATLWRERGAAIGGGRLRRVEPLGRAALDRGGVVAARP
ncbi:MAG: 2-amino-4-hydroxy-6-hydroxymethyldihydropteridine diphosphokinase [Chromatiales bacterium]|nr:2-amino-4-hydroxy-6-hydroxymethyldihydropteridine diphosphokinase [Chromatiales bacterium]